MAQRSIGTDLPYSENAMAFYAFVNDTWRVSRNLSLNLGLRYEYNGVSQSMKDLALNSVSNVPGVLASPRRRRKRPILRRESDSRIRPATAPPPRFAADSASAYDPIFDNVGENVRPPQDSYLLTLPLSGAAKFLANGGIPPNALAAQPQSGHLRLAAQPDAGLRDELEYGHSA